MSQSRIAPSRHFRSSRSPSTRRNLGSLAARSRNRRWPVEKLSMPITCCPPDSSRSVSELPMKPAHPVTRNFICRAWCFTYTSAYKDQSALGDASLRGPAPNSFQEEQRKVGLPIPSRRSGAMRQGRSKLLLHSKFHRLRVIHGIWCFDASRAQLRRALDNVLLIMSSPSVFLNRGRHHRVQSPGGECGRLAL